MNSSALTRLLLYSRHLAKSYSAKSYLLLAIKKSANSNHALSYSSPNSG